MRIRIPIFVLILVLGFSLLCAQEERTRQETRRAKVAGTPVPVPTPQPVADLYIHLTRSLTHPGPRAGAVAKEDDWESPNVVVASADKIIVTGRSVTVMVAGGGEQGDLEASRRIETDAALALFDDLLRRLSQAMAAKEREGREELINFCDGFCADLARYAAERGCGEAASHDSSGFRIWAEHQDHQALVNHVRTQIESLLYTIYGGDGRGYVAEGIRMRAGEISTTYGGDGRTRAKYGGEVDGTPVPVPIPDPAAEFYLRFSRGQLSLFPSRNREAIRVEGNSVSVNLLIAEVGGADDRPLRTKAVNIIRVDLVDRLTRAIDEKQGEGQEALAGFYADLSVVLADYGVDFGDRPANSADREEHYRWALREDPRLLRELLIERISKALETIAKTTALDDYP